MPSPVVLISLLLAAGATLVSSPPARAQTTITTTTVKRTDAHLQPTQDAHAPLAAAPLRASPKAAQTGSSSITITQTSISLLYLADGAGNGATALAVPLYVIPGASNRVKLCGIGAVGLGGGTSAQIYMGTAVSYLLYSSKTGWSATVFAGLKGVSLTTGRLPNGFANAVFGLGISIPVRSL